MWTSIITATGVGSGVLRWGHIASDLAVGTYVDTITVVAVGAAGSPVVIYDTLTISPLPPRIALSDSAVVFTADVYGAVIPGARQVQVSNGGSGTLAGLMVSAVSYQASDSPGWLTASLSSATGPATLTLAPAVRTLTVGTHVATLTIASTANDVIGGPRVLTVSVVVSPVVGVSAWHSQSCAWTGAGTAYCWGTTGSPLGAVGDGTTSQRLTPVRIGGAEPVAEMSAGSGNGGNGVCSLNTSGIAYCWGDNGLGQVGDGTNIMRLTPTMVLGGLQFAHIARGAQHTCALTSSGAAYCWGLGLLGELGNGGSLQQLVPGPVTGNLTFAEITGHEETVCARTPIGVAYCWGSSAIGDGVGAKVFAPTLVLGGLAFVQISAGGAHACGITQQGEAYCWGDNTWGQLGTGTFVSALVPVRVIGGLVFAEIGAGGSHTCARTTAGAAYCWGENSGGKIGAGVGSTSAPAAVLGGLSFIKLAVGSRHNCALATDARVFCWGENLYGQLGDGTLNNRGVPTLVRFP